MTQDAEGRRGLSLPSETVASLVASFVPGLGPLLGPLAARLSQALGEEWQRNTSRSLRAAEKVSGLSREDLAEAIAADPRLVPLLTRVLFQAGMSGSDDKLQALGAGLGWAVADAANRHR